MRLETGKAGSAALAHCGSVEPLLRVPAQINFHLTKGLFSFTLPEWGRGRTGGIRRRVYYFLIACSDL